MQLETKPNKEEKINKYQGGIIVAVFSTYAKWSKYHTYSISDCLRVNNGTCHRHLSPPLFGACGLLLGCELLLLRHNAQNRDVPSPDIKRRIARTKKHNKTTNQHNKLPQQIKLRVDFSSAAAATQSSLVPFKKNTLYFKLQHYHPY